MKSYIRPVVLIKRKDAEKLFSSEQFENRDSASFRVTLSADSKFISATPLDHIVDASNVGLNPVFGDNGEVTIDAKITAVLKGDFIPAVANNSYGKMAWAFVAPITGVESSKDYAFKDFRLRRTYLKCPEHLFDSYSSLEYAIATIDTKTQTVVSFKSVDGFYGCEGFEWGADEDRFLGTVLNESGDLIEVTAYCANAGFNFTRYVK